MGYLGSNMDTNQGSNRKESLPTGDVVIGIDPGTNESGYATILSDYSILDAGKITNEDLLGYVNARSSTPIELVVESIQSYGHAMGKSTIETCYFIGRLLQVADEGGVPLTLYPRPEYARSICACMKVNDAIVRRSLISRFGGDKKGEPLEKLKGNSDKRSAFAVAAYHLDLKRYPKEPT